MSVGRKAHQLYARIRGVFWLPCPACGRMFGGHEIGNTETRIQGTSWVNCKLHDTVVDR